MRYFFESYEIYNEDIYDLMDEESIEDKIKLEIKEGRDGTYVLRDLTQLELKNIKDSQEIIQEALDNRQFANTILNKTSSRSHTIFKITFHFTWEKDSSH